METKAPDRPFHRASTSPVNWKIFNETLKLVLEARHKARAFELIERFAQLAGSEHLAVLHLLPGKDPSAVKRTELFSRSTRVSNLLSRLKTELLSEELKPVYRSSRPTHITDLSKFLKLSKLARLGRLAAVARFDSALAISVRSQAQGTYCFVFAGKNVSNDYTIVAALGTLVHITIESLYSESSVPKLLTENPFSPRESECLRLLTLGMEDADIGAALGISERTVRFHLDRARMKIGARNRAHAVALVVGERIFETK